MEKPVPADLEEAAKNYAMRDKWTYEHFGDVVMKAVFFGAKWQEEQDKWCKEHGVPPVHWTLKQWRNQRTESGYPILGPNYDRNF